MRNDRLGAVLAGASLLVALSGSAALAAPSGQPGSPISAPAIWADGELLATIGLEPLPYNGNMHAFDQLFMVPGQGPVSEAAPGRGYNGGRWLPVEVSWNVAPYLLTSYADVQAAQATGDISLGEPQFEAAFHCPLIPVR